MGLFDRFFSNKPAAPTRRTGLVVLPPRIGQALMILPETLLMFESEHPPAEAAALDAGMSLYLKWEEIFQSASIGNCLFVICAQASLDESQKETALRRTFERLQSTESLKNLLWPVQQFMDHVAPVLERGQRPEAAIGSWMLQTVASLPEATPTLKSMANSPEMCVQHGRAVMAVTGKWLATV